MHKYNYTESLININTTCGFEENFQWHSCSGKLSLVLCKREHDNVFINLHQLGTYGSRGRRILSKADAGRSSLGVKCFGM